MSFLPRAYVKHWLEEHSVRILPNGALRGPDKMDKPQVLVDLYQDYLEDISAHNAIADKGKQAMRYSRADIHEAVDSLVKSAQVELRLETTEAIKCEREDLTTLRTFLQAVTGKVDDVDLAVMAHFAWQVKRKLMGKHVVWHTMPIFVGAQGGGKSTALRDYLFKPLEYYVMDFDIESVTDPRSTKALQDHLICFFDEMQKAHRADIDTLKNRITAKHVDYRPMRSNDTVKIDQNCTFIGSSNRDVSLMIFDSTGMRRFYQLNCLEVVDWELLKTVDCLALWRGVDENREIDYLEPVREQLKAAQRELTIEDDVVVFMAEFGFSYGEGEDTEEVSMADVYKVYKDWAEENSIRALSSALFSRKVVSLGFSLRRTKLKGKEVKYLTVRKQEAISHADVIRSKQFTGA